MDFSFMKRLGVELFATYSLVLVGTGSIVLNDTLHGIITHTGISAAFGTIVFLMILLFGEYSGAHMNPSVTLTLACMKQFPRKEMGYYFAAQLTGALLASFSIRLLFPDHPNLGSTIPHGPWWHSFLLETLMSFLLMLMILWVGERKNLSLASAGFFIGFIVFLEAYFGGPISGASMNPARSFGPAIVSGNIQFLWLYLLAPTFGMMLCSILFLFRPIR
jgi:aquaporin Z